MRLAHSRVRAISLVPAATATSRESVCERVRRAEREPRARESVQRARESAQRARESAQRARERAKSNSCTCPIPAAAAPTKAL